MELSVFRADPAGNITLFVQSFVMQEKRAEAATRLMARFDAEQVAFVVPGGDADGAIEMMGGEFCGNATRAYGAYLAEKVGKQELSLRVSGCETPVAVEVEGSYATAQMPLPRAVRAYLQRAGTISARLRYREGVIEEASIGGKVSFDAPITVEI